MIAGRQEFKAKTIKNIKIEKNGGPIKYILASVIRTEEAKTKAMKGFFVVNGS